MLAEDGLLKKYYAKPLYIDVYGLGYNVPHGLVSLLCGSYSCSVGNEDGTQNKQREIAMPSAADGAVLVSQTRGRPHERANLAYRSLVLVVIVSCRCSESTTVNRSRYKAVMWMCTIPAVSKVGLNACTYSLGPHIRALHLLQEVSRKIQQPFADWTTCVWRYPSCK